MEHMIVHNNRMPLSFLDKKGFKFVLDHPSRFWLCPKARRKVQMSGTIHGQRKEHIENVGGKHMARIS